MYKFIGINEKQQNDYLPSVALNFNGECLDEEIDGYRTLRVGGRETIGVELISEEVKEGLITTDHRLPHREIEVTYQLQAEDGTRFQAEFKRLRKLLTTNEQVPIKFKDEPDTTYFGRLGAMETVPDDRNNIVGKFTIHCDSPFKFGNLITTSGTVTVDTFYTALPEKITLSIEETTNRIKITNGNQTISATGTFNEGVEVVILFTKEEVTMTVNNEEATYMIDLQSDLENFYLEEGQTIKSNQGEIEIDMRERWL